ncbi:FAD/NAD(P)-binding oxidoreductase [Spirochaetia bacterium]|nr:FAD/NAD(P)-binding oxidoreductase [Spirochaetia bacterium]
MRNNILTKKLAKISGTIQAKEQDGCVWLTGKVSTWDESVRAGMLAAGNLKKRATVVNNIEVTDEPLTPPCLPAFSDNALEGEKPDVLVIGGGVTGCAVARELSRYDIKILLVEKEHDVALHASSRNDGMVHVGIDLHKGTKKYHYNMRGNAMYGEVCRELGVAFERPGQYLCFASRLLKPVLYLSLAYWKYMGISGVRVLGKKELTRLERNLAKDLSCALYFPSGGVVCPYNLTIAYAENAVQNGARVMLDTAVTGMSVDGGTITKVRTNRGTIYPRVVINAAGVFAEDIAGMAKDRFYSIHPRKGANAILDSKYSGFVASTNISKLGKLPAKTHSKGGGIVRTVHGNLLIGPDAHETNEREDFATEAASIRTSFEKFRATSAVLHESQIITYFTGVRAPTYEEDFVVCKGKRTRNLVHAAGIQSPGLTAAPAIAVDVARFAVEILEGETNGTNENTPRPLAESPVTIRKNENFNPLRVPIPHLAKLEIEDRQKLIARNPDYGVIVCRCEEVSRGEILDSLRRPLPCDTIDGVKRRVRPGMGRCQGGFCGPLVLQLIAREKGITPDAVCKSGAGSEVLFGPTKGGAV